jgi:hypothetical protein
MGRSHAVSDPVEAGTRRRPLAITVFLSVLFACLVVSEAAAGTAHHKLVIPGTGYEVIGGARQVDETGLPKRDLIASVARWLSSEFALPQPKELPAFRLVSAETLVAVRYGPLARNASDQTATRSAHAYAEAGDDIVALYDDRARTIYLSDDWSGRDAGEISVVVHEMIHHLQNLAGDTYSCAAEREKLAYKAQERFLELFGRSLESEFSLDPMTLLVRTTCAM